MDITWILFEALNTRKYTIGIEGFMKHVRAYTEGNEEVDVFCPCRICMNVGLKPQHIVADHIFIHRMEQSYIRWIKHGEPYDQPNDIDPLSYDGYLPEDHQGDKAAANLLRDLHPYASQQPHGYRKILLYMTW